VHSATQPKNFLSDSLETGRGGVTLGAEGEEALKNRRCVKTWGPGPSSDPGSEIVALAAAAVVAATGAPGGDHPQMVVVAAGPMVVVVVAVTDPMVVVAVGPED
jgi:hypothetical protein